MRKNNMKFYGQLKARLKTIQWKMVKTKNTALKEAQRLCREFHFTTRMDKFLLAKGGESDAMVTIELPSNQKFGFFFTFILASAAAYFFNSAKETWAYELAGAALIFLVVTVVKSDVLLPLNKIWMRFGLLLGKVVSPIILGMIFFGLFTPIATLMRLNGRDVLRLRFSQKKTHWLSRGEKVKPESFKRQF